jgi:dTDP-4-dehydrorhamnose 3,5-epimerase
MPSTFTPLGIPGVVLLDRAVFPDDRGYFTELFKRSELEANGVPSDFVQENVVRSGANVVRGLHFQNPDSAQGKLVSVVLGAVWDVAVDLRKSSPTFGEWVAEELSEENGRSLWLPEGFGHGYAVLSDEALVVYGVTSEYAPESEAGVIWDDPELGIDWPYAEPLLSPKDAVLPTLGEASIGFD